MGYSTPNIDRIAAGGMIFTDCYGEQSCTAGRSAFITGQSVFRTGLSKVGMPGADLGIRAQNGPQTNHWPDGGTTPFRSEKNTNWEGCVRDSFEMTVLPMFRRLPAPESLRGFPNPDMPCRHRI